MISLKSNGLSIPPLTAANPYCLWINVLWISSTPRASIIRLFVLYFSSPSSASYNGSIGNCGSFISPFGGKTTSKVGIKLFLCNLLTFERRRKRISLETLLIASREKQLKWLRSKNHPYQLENPTNNAKKLLTKKNFWPEKESRLDFFCYFNEMAFDWFFLRIKQIVHWMLRPVAITLHICRKSTKKSGLSFTFKSKYNYPFKNKYKII